MISPMHDPRQTDFHRGDLWTTTHRPPPAKKKPQVQSMDQGATVPITVSRDSDEMTSDIDEKLLVRDKSGKSLLSVNEGVGLDFRKIKDAETVSDPYTITHRAGGMEMAPDMSMTHSNIGMTPYGMSITSKLERQYDEYARNA